MILSILSASYLACVSSSAAFLAPQKDASRDDWTFSAETIYTAEGEPITGGGTVVIKDGKITALTTGSGSADLKVAAITPGMIDASVRIDIGRDSVEQSREVTPELRAYDALDPFHVGWARAARSGVTSALVNGEDWNVIGGLSCLLKTAGPDLAARVLSKEAALRGSMGTQPSSGNHPAFGRPTDFFSRRPTTRMGVEWELRKAFYDAGYAKGDAKRAFPGSDRLIEVLDGKLPLMLQAWATQDIRTAVFLKEEMQREGMGEMRLIIDAAAEAAREPQLLVRSNTAVVLPPLPWQGRAQDQAFMALDTAKVLDGLGVLVALSSHNATQPELRLDRQAALAIRGGLSFDAALRAVTINPAKMFGVDDRVGSIKAGKDADLVLWSGKPFELTSRVVGVVIDGRLVLDPRGDA